LGETGLGAGTIPLNAGVVPAPRTTLRPPKTRLLPHRVTQNVTRPQPPAAANPHKATFFVTLPPRGRHGDFALVKALPCTCAISTPASNSMSHSTVFTNNRSQAVRLPADARLPPHVKRVEVRVRGAERIIVPAGHEWDSFFADDAPRVSDDFLPQRATQEQPPRQGL
jgi:antitoxin VapB